MAITFSPCPEQRSGSHITLYPKGAMISFTSVQKGDCDAAALLHSTHRYRPDPRFWIGEVIEQYVTC